MGNKKISISVIIPVYNSEKYLHQCIDSVLTQTFTDFELLLIDDGSTDNSGTICDEYAEKEMRIRVFHKENGGVSSARNVGLKAAKGEWISFVDADDYLLPDALSALYNAAISSGSDLILANTQRLKKGKLVLSPAMKEETTTDVVVSLKQFALWGYLLRADIINNNNLRFVDGLAYSEDRVFIYQFGLHCRAVTYINVPVYVYRIHSASVCHSSNGVRKAYHHFWAAKELEMLAERNNITKNVYAKLYKERNRVIGLGMYFFVEQVFTKIDYAKVKQDYLAFYGKERFSNIKFQLFFVKKYVLAKRRKIITFRK